MKRTTILILLIAFALLGSRAARAETVNIMDNALEKTFTLAEDSTVNLMGNRNNLKVIGNDCTLNVTGNQNVLTVDGADCTVNLMGNQNTIKVIRVKGREEPTINHMGRDNQVQFIDR